MENVQHVYNLTVEGADCKDKPKFGGSGKKKTVLCTKKVSGIFLLTRSKHKEAFKSNFFTGGNKVKKRHARKPQGYLHMNLSNSAAERYTL